MGREKEGENINKYTVRVTLYMYMKMKTVCNNNNYKNVATGIETASVCIKKEALCHLNSQVAILIALPSLIHLHPQCQH